MKLINQSVEIWEQSEGEVGIYKQIEKAAMPCYKSEDSYKRFLGRFLRLEQTLLF